MGVRAVVIQLILSGSLLVAAQVVIVDESRIELGLGPCVLVLWEPCGSERLKFKLNNRYYRSSPKDLDILSPDAGVGFNPSLPLKVLIHGYGGGVEYYNPTYEIGEAYLNNDDYNIISVQWAAFSELPCYPLAVINTWHVAKCTAELLVTMHKKYPAFEPWNGHAIGFSMGSHIAAYTSNEILTSTGKHFARITGLDPAWPLFNSLFGDPTVYLDATDANFVDIIHTNAGFFGKTEASGHQDFYVNGGTFQKACVGNPYPNICSHMMAGKYFAESITAGPHTGFWSAPCPSYKHYVDGNCTEDGRQYHDRALMGEYSRPGPSGTFVLSTSGSPPYALG